MVGGEMFGTPGQWLFVLLLILAIGAGLGKACSRGCDYAKEHISVGFTGSTKGK
jgi:hypothetical protein